MVVVGFVVETLNASFPFGSMSRELSNLRREAEAVRSGIVKWILA